MKKLLALIAIFIVNCPLSTVHCETKPKLVVGIVIDQMRWDYLERYKDRYDKLTNNKDGVAGWNGYYDNAGQLVITNCYDQDRMKVAVPDGLGQ